MIAYDPKNWDTPFITQQLLIKITNLTQEEISSLRTDGIITKPDKVEGGWISGGGRAKYSRRDMITCLRYWRLRREFKFTHVAAVAMLRMAKWGYDNK